MNMQFFLVNCYSNLIESKFSSSSNLISNKILFEIRFDELENLDDEAVLKGFYFFFLIFNRLTGIKDFKSRYHLGKTFYKFGIFITIYKSNIDYFLLNFLQFHLIEPSKLTFESTVFSTVAKFKVSDLRAFYLIESNPHFFKWNQELNISFYPLGNRSLIKKEELLNIYFWNLNNIKNHNFHNFWNYYVS